MNLYEDLPPASGSLKTQTQDTSKSSVLSIGSANLNKTKNKNLKPTISSTQLLPPSLLMKKNATASQIIPNQVTSGIETTKINNQFGTMTSDIPPSLFNQPLLPNSPPPKTHQPMEIQSPQPTKILHEPRFDVDDPYDPAQPNDYMEFCEQRLQRKRAAEIQREFQLQMEEQEKLREKMAEERRKGIEPNSFGRALGRGRGVSNLPAWMAQKKEETETHPTRPIPPFSNASEIFDKNEPEKQSTGNIGSVLMEKLGGFKGGGLGKFGQGISQPLMHEDMGGGKARIVVQKPEKESRIIPPVPSFSSSVPSNIDESSNQGSSGSTIPPPPPKFQSQSQVTTTTMLKKKRGLFTNPTKVVLLKNMVGPGEVDDTLESETKEECEKYGPVQKCVIFEIVDESVPSEERVRTFVTFERQESAVKCYVEMNKRFFGGRQILAEFFDEARLARGELAPYPNEIQMD